VTKFHDKLAVKTMNDTLSD